MGTCPNCGSEVDGQDRFCQRCGHPLEVASRAPAMCPRCGGVLEVGEQFCLWCGLFVGRPPVEVTPGASVQKSPDAGSSGGGWDFAAIALLAVVLIVSAVSLVSAVRELALLARIHSGGAFTQAEAASNDARQRLIAHILLVALALTGLVWLVWQYRAHAALRRRHPSVRFIPAMGVAWWFVPLANLVMVFRAVRELRVAQPEGHMTVEQKRAPPVRWWWGMYLLTSALAVGSAAESYAATSALPDKQAYFADAFAHEWLFILSRIAQIVATALAIGIVFGVQSRLRPATAGSWDPVGRPGLEPGPPD
jgi:hypothetical protein